MRRLFLFISVGMMALQLGCANSGAEDLRPELAALKEELTALKTTVQTLNEALELHVGVEHQWLTAKRLTIQDEVGNDLIYAGGDTEGNGQLRVYKKDGKNLIYAGAGTEGNGQLTVANKDGKDLIYAGANDNGALMLLFNKTGEDIIHLTADDYGNGVVGAYNRKGMGRTLESK